MNYETIMLDLQCKADQCYDEADRLTDLVLDNPSTMDFSGQTQSVINTLHAEAHVCELVASEIYRHIWPDDKWMAEINAQMEDHADLIDTQECARF